MSLNNPTCFPDMLKFSRFDRHVIFLLVILSAVMGVLLWSNGRAGMAAPDLNLPENGQVGAFGPLTLKFRQPVSDVRIESYLGLEPEVAGQWTWDGNTASFRPQQAFQVGRSYTVRLRQGAMDDAGRILKVDLTWSFTVRMADIIYLGQANERPEVWLADGAGYVIQPLTDTGGNVQDFAGFSSGEQIVYCVKNDQGGIDLWVVDRNGENNRELLDCGTDSCIEPDVAPDESAITFSRLSEEMPQGEIWTIDLLTGQSAALYPNQTVSGIEPDWSPHGRYLQFYDPVYAQIRVLDLSEDKVILIPTNQQAVGAWSPDGEKLLFTRAESSAIGLPYVRVYEVDLASGDIQLLEASDLGQVDSSLPVFSPDGETLVIALRGLASSANKQLWLVSLDGSASQPITDDERASFAAYTWDSSGETLAFQRLQLESSQSRPQVMTWQPANDTFTVVAEDAAWPQWLP
jgi:Tol biopolymer transport system component